MADLIGGSLSEIEQLGTTSREVGEQTSAVFATVKGKTDAFNGDIEEMTERLRRDFDEFTDEVDQEAARLLNTASGTNWQGLSGEAKVARTEEIQANAQAFNSQALTNVETFRNQLRTMVEEYYDHIANEMAGVIEEMQAVHESEAEHSARYAQSARELDEAAANV